MEREVSTSVLGLVFLNRIGLYIMSVRLLGCVISGLLVNSLFLYFFKIVED